MPIAAALMRRDKKENAVLHTKYSVYLVRQEGLEPPTYWFVASHSIQLSYWRTCLIQLYDNTISTTGSQDLFVKKISGNPDESEICRNCVACMAGMYIFAQAIVFGKIFPYNKTVSFKLVQLRTSIGKEKFPMITINMLSRADSVKGQGVLSAYQEQVKLVKEELADEFLCYENRNAFCDIMHYHTINPEFYAMRQLSRGRSVSVGYVHFLPETLDKSLKLPDHIRDVFYRYVIRFYKSMDYLVTVNPYFIGELEKYGISREKVTYIPNFVSEEQFYPLPPEEKAALREKYGIPEGKFIVFCAGQLQRRKGFFDYIELARRMPDVLFLWAGSFAFGLISDGHDEIKAILENPPENFRLLGLVERERMNELYNLTDLMLLPSFEELFPMTILEAMNCHTPILLRDLDIYHDILFDFYLRADGVDGFEQEIRRLQQDAAYYQEAEARSAKGHAFYSKENVARMWRTFYHGVVSKRPAGASRGKNPARFAGSAVRRAGEQLTPGRKK